MSYARVWAASMILLAAGPTARGDEPKSATKLGSEIRVPGNLGFSFTISEDQRTANVLFANATVDLGRVVKSPGGVQGKTAVAAKQFTLEVPYTTDLRSVPMTMDLRGTCSADSGARLRLVACAGDATQAVDLTGESKADAPSKKSKSSKKAPSEDAAAFKDFNHRIRFTVPTHARSPVLQITLIFLIEHDTDVDGAGGGFLTLDSLDLEFAADAKGAYKK